MNPMKKRLTALNEGGEKKNPNVVVKHSVENYSFLLFIMKASILMNSRQFNKTFTELCLPANHPSIVI